MTTITRPDHIKRWPAVVALLLVVVIIGGLTALFMRLDAKTDACEARGATMVKTPDGWRCVYVIPLEEP